ncbi:hypothetical protein IE53DRAFT_346747 [Violaceomyces palustris]|uniref:Uncharacterized protein n=1 Tax=Violaceomyces palustris TaxID=1673888 RepID=A0ACD0NSW9_9BASI|nr:hypothetical protein IE53DRAFT_346747 [Violaceomyces palustris]
MPSPPKPWERAGATPTSDLATATTTTTIPTSTTTSSSSAPPIPERPSTLSNASALTNSSAYTNSAYTSRPYANSMGGLGSTYTSSYGSPYSRFGGMGYGGYGTGAYGGYGSGYGGYGAYGGYGGGYGMGMGMGMGGMGMPGQPGDPSLTQRMEAGTAATFELISSIVGAFGGFAQMLESTFMATHSSFFAMVGVADQFSHLRNYLGQVLSIFAMARYIKNLALRLVGKKPAIELDPREFGEFAANGGAKGGAKAPRPSKRPLVFFFLAVIGLPYLMGKLVKLITAKQEAERQRLEAAGQAGQLQPGMMPGQQQHDGAEAALDPSKLTFVRALYAYPATDPLELNLEPNDIVAVLSKHDPQTGEESAWWRGRTRDGRIGWFPAAYVESLETAKEKASKAASAISTAKIIEPSEKAKSAAAAIKMTA